MKMSSAKARRVGSRRLRAAVMALERRHLLTTGAGSFADLTGTLAANGIGVLGVRVDRADFTLPRGQVLVGFTVDGATSSLIGVQPGGRGQIHFARGASLRGGPPTLGARLRTGTYRLYVGGQGGPEGTFQVHAYLAGDANGDYQVDRFDLGLIRAARGQRRGQAGYIETYDTNRNGIINLGDLLLAARNLGARTLVRPLTATLELGPDANPDEQGRVQVPDITLVGQAHPGAALQLDQNSDRMIDATATADAAGHFAFAVTLQTGPNAFVIEARDRFGQVVRASLNVELLTSPPDTTAPTVTIESPPPATTSGAVTVLGRVADVGSGVASLTVQVDDGPAQPVPFDPITGAFSYTTDVLADGLHTLRFVASDHAGNVSGPALVGFTVDSSPLTITHFDLSVGSTSGTPQQTAAAIVVLVGQTRPNVTVTLVETGATTTSNNVGAFQFHNVALAEGPNTFHVVATDGLGHTATASRTFTRATEAAADDAVLYWNNVVLDTILVDNSSPVVAARSLAIVQSAVYDAVNAVEGLSGQFVTVAAPAHASLPAAVAGAAERTLRTLYPAQAATFAAALASTLAEVPDGSAETAGLAVGRQVADAILAWRLNDGSTVYALDEGSSEPGAWRPTLPNFDPGLKPAWGAIEPFVLTSADQFPLHGPPDLTSTAYADALDEVRRLGALNSTERTADQTEIAHFWADGVGTITPVGHWYWIAQTAAQAAGNSLGANARLFAMLGVALADAAIACWYAKYQHDFWRPITAIREADSDGNPATVAEPSWLPLIPTPPFPSYTSGHSTFSTAAAVILEAVFGADVGFTVGSPGLPGVNRSYTSFEEAALEASVSRLYGGIHYRFDNLDGLSLGKQIGEYVLGVFAGDDQQAPIVTVSSLAPDAVLAGNATVTGLVNDAVSGVASLTVQVDGGAPQPVAFDPLTGAFAFPTTLLADGPHTLLFVATDHAGNTSRPRVLTLTLDTTAPEVSLASLTDGSPIDAAAG